MRERVWRRRQTDDDYIDEDSDSFDEDIEPGKGDSNEKSLTGSIFGRLRGIGKKKKDDILEPINTDSLDFENDDIDFVLPNTDSASEKSTVIQNDKSVLGKKSLKETNKTVPDNILAVKNEDGNEKIAGRLSNSSNLSVQQTPETREPDVVDIVESNDETLVETLGGCADDSEEPDLLANIFKNDLEESDSPLEIFIASLPHVEIDEVVDESKEVKALIRQWHQNVMLK